MSLQFTGGNTIVSYTVLEDDFIIVGDYSAEVVFYTENVYEDSTETFRWIITDSAE